MGAPGSTTTVSPRRIRLEASSFCQLRCPSCPTTSGAIHPAVGSGFLEFEDFQRLLDLNPNLERIEISNYGEVFLNPHLLRILEYAYRKGVSITLENGVNLNHAKEEALEGLVSYRVKIVTCSIDGASPETYRTYRVRGDFDAVIGNIERINVHKHAQGSDLPHLVWQFVVFGHNEHEIPIAREMADRLGMEFRTKLTWDSKLSPIRYIDLNTVVHRSSLTETYGGFDEGLDRLVDWDLLLRMTRDKPGSRVPVLAAQYRVVDDQRVSVTSPFQSNYDAIRRKWGVSAED